MGGSGAPYNGLEVCLGLAGSEALVGEAARILAGARHAVALTGAGVSTASGIPDFRGPRGLWRRVDPEVFSIDYFLSSPMEAWRVFAGLYRKLGGVKPNPAHYALAALEAAGVLKAVITQNIDGLHQAAGSRRVVEIHGSAVHAVCLECGYRVPLSDAVREAEEGRVPRCPRCGGILKPDVTFFGEPLPEKALMEALSLAWRSDVMLVAGSSLAVSPANQLPQITKMRGGKLIIVNVGETMLDHLADVKIEAPVEEALPAICEETLKLIGENPEGCRGPQQPATQQL